MLDGWVKLWRKSLGNGMLQNHKLWAVWCWCLMQATHKPKCQVVGRQTVDLMPGQFVFGRKKTAESLALSERSIRTCLEQLQAQECMTIRSTNKYSVATIVNWEFYQGQDQPATSRCPTDGQQISGQSASRCKLKAEINQNVTENEPHKVTSMRPANRHQMTSRWSDKRPADDQEQQGFTEIGDQQMTSRWPEIDQQKATNKKKRREEEKKEEEEGDVSPTSPPQIIFSVPLKEIACCWNEAMTRSKAAIPRLSRITQGTQRYKHVRARWKEHPDMMTWKEMFSRVAVSSFLNGTNNRGWTASFDWLLKKDNFLKALEGNYDDKESKYGQEALF